MALTIGDNFSYQGAKPLDGRIKYDTLAAMKAMADSTLYDGCLAYCVATDKTYQWKSTNTVDADTGKWREFTSGGGTGGGHTIEDPEGTALTQRDTLQFGGDLEVSDDDENEKTVVAPHELTAAELTEIMSTLPGQPTQGITIDLRGNEQVVGKVIESDGTEKTLYQKMFDTTTPSSLYTDKSVQVNALLDKIFTIKASMYIDGGWHSIEDSSFVWATFSSSPTVKGMKIIVRDNTASDPNVILMICSADNWLNKRIYITIRYTKTTS